MSKIAARVWWRMWAPNYTRRDTASKTPRDEAWVRPRVRGRRACARGAARQELLDGERLPLSLQGSGVAGLRQRHCACAVRLAVQLLEGGF